MRFTRAERSMRPERRENMPFANSLLARARTMDGTGMGRAAMVVRRRRADPAGHRADPRARRVPRHHRRCHRHVQPSRFLKGLELAGERKPFILAGRDKVLAHPWLGKEQGSAEQRARGRLSNLDEVNDPVLAAMWAPDPNELAWLGAGSSVSGHWNWVGDRSHGWIYRRSTTTGRHR